MCMHRGHAVAELERGLETLGQPLADVGAWLEAVDHGFDGVFLAQGQRRDFIDVRTGRH